MALFRDLRTRRLPRVIADDPAGTSGDRAGASGEDGEYAGGRASSVLATHWPRPISLARPHRADHFGEPDRSRRTASVFGF